MATLDWFQTALRQLLPRGRAWVFHPGGVVDRLLGAAAGHLLEGQERIEQLVVESDPLRAVELLPDWERSVGLPDDCSPRFPEPSTLDRQRAVHARLTAAGGQTIASLIDVAARLGYVVTIDEFHVCVSGGASSGDPCYDDEWAGAFQVNAPLDVVSYAESGTASSGDPLASWGDERLECEIERVKPAHMVALYVYT